MIDKRLRYANHCKIKKADVNKGWVMVHEPITKADVEQHFNNGVKYGVPFIKRGEHSAILGMIDLDDHTGDIGWDGMVDIAAKVCVAAEERGLRPNPYRSNGGKGINLWFAWAEPQDAHSMRQLMRQVIDDCGYREGAGGVIANQLEIFPKQSNVAVDGDGNCAAIPRLPLDPLDLDDCEQYQWSDSDPVPYVEQPVVESVEAEQLSLEQIDELLSHIDPAGMDQDEWYRVIAAIKDSGGTFEQAVAWTDRDSKWAGREDEWKFRWDSFKRGLRGAGVTAGAGTLRFKAHEGGWQGVTAVVEQFPESDVGMDYNRDKKGKIEVTVSQVRRCVLLDPSFPWYVNHDEFFGEIFVSGKTDGKIERLGDHHYTQMRVWFDDHNWKSVSKEMVRDVIYSAAKINSGDIMLTWLDGLVWDGKDRLGQFVEALGLVDNEYHEAVARYILTGLAARQLNPGCQLDITPILIGKQGAGKTRSCLALAPKFVDTLTSAECAATDLIDMDRSARLVRGKSVMIMDELRGMKREREAIKAALTRGIEEHTPKYMENRVQFKRRCILIGTTNEDEFLDDPTGARRFAPVQLDHTAKPEWVSANLDQLWAQGLMMYKRDGVNWKQVQTLAADVHHEYHISDTWEDVIQDYIDNSVLPITVRGLLVDALNFENRAIKRSDEMRVADILKKMGRSQIRKTVDGVKLRIWE